MSLRCVAVALISVGLCPTGMVAQAEGFSAVFQQGAAALREGRLDAAATEFSRCITLNPGFAPSYFNLGLVRLQQGHTDEAADLLRKTIQIKADTRGAHFFLGMAEYRLDRYADAVKTLRRAVDEDPGNGDALMWLGIAELAAGDASGATEHLEKASKLKPNNVDVLYHLGRAFMQMSKETYERMYQADPKSWRVHQVLAQSFTEADRMEDAVKECNLAIELRPREPGLHQQLGEIYWKQNLLDEAEAAFQKELEIAPLNLTATYKLAAVSTERAKPQVALELLKSVLAQHPDSREALYQRGRAEAQLGKSEDAIRDFSAVVHGTAEADPDVIRQSYYQLSQLYRRTEHPEEARLALNSFMKLKQEADEQREQKLQDKMKRAAEPSSR